MHGAAKKKSRSAACCFLRGGVQAQACGVLRLSMVETQHAALLPNVFRPSASCGRPFLFAQRFTLLAYALPSSELPSGYPAGFFFLFVPELHSACVASRA